MMPGMDGVETVEKIRKTMPDLPVYALTANSSAGEEFYISKGFNGYLSKPIDSITLERTIMKHLPDEIMMHADGTDITEENDSLPDDMQWITEVENISVPDGIKNSGGAASFVSSLQIFADTFNGAAKVIEDAYNSDDIKLFTIKVHALKSSARIIGAVALSELAAKLEDAGGRGDRDLIDGNAGILLDEYRSLGSSLARINEKDAGNAIPEDELRDAYAALKDLIPQMDYDSVEMIIEQLEEYTLPEEDKDRIARLKGMLRAFDWDNMEELIKNV